VLLREQLAVAQEQARVAYLRAARAAARQGASEAEQQIVGEAAAEEVRSALINDLLTLSVRYGQSPRIPTIDDPQFVQAVVFDPRVPGQPKPRFSSLFPSGESALISVRLRPELSDAERGEAIDQIRAAVADPAFRIRDAEYVVSGVPVVVDGVAEELSAKIFLLLVVAVAVMALTLALLVGPPLRLLPLATALATVGIVFGALSLFGGSLTLASLAVLPVLQSTAGWAARRTGDTTSPPRDPAAFARFLGSLVDRYGPRGSLWDERGDRRRRARARGVSPLGAQARGLHEISRRPPLQLKGCDAAPAPP